MKYDDVYHAAVLHRTPFDLEVVAQAPVHKILGQFPVLLVVPISDVTNDSRIIRELLQVTDGCSMRRLQCKW